MPPTKISREAAYQADWSFRSLFKDCYVLWRAGGAYARELNPLPGPALTHVVIPKAPIDEGSNRIWERVAELAASGKIEAKVAPEPDTTLCEVRRGVWGHTIALATGENLGARLAQHIGPPSFAEMLRRRLEDAGALKLMNGIVYAIDRSTEPTVLRPIPVNSEEKFFRLARTAYKGPRFRFVRRGTDRPGWWKRGMEPEWYPPGVIPFADPRQPGLFDDRSKRLPGKLRPRDVDRWLHS